MAYDDNSGMLGNRASVESACVLDDSVEVMENLRVGYRGYEFSLGDLVDAMR